MNRRDITIVLVAFAAFSAAGYMFHPWVKPFGNDSIFHFIMLPMRALAHLYYPQPVIMEKAGVFVSAAAWAALIGLLLAAARTLLRKKEPNRVAGSD